MGIEEYKVVISRNARSSLKNIVKYITRRTSKTAAQRVRKELISLAKSLKHNPQIYSKELYLNHLGGEIRSLPKWSYKIIFEITGNQVRILDFFHTSLHPDRMDE